MRNPIKALVNRWVQEVLDDKAVAKQAACKHLVSGTIKDSVLICDQCEKVLTPEDRRRA